MDPVSRNERVVLEVLVRANGQMDIATIVNATRARMGLGSSRTRGFRDLVIQCLKGLQAKTYATVDGASHRRPPRSVKEHHNEEQKALLAMAEKGYYTSLWAATPRGRLALDQLSTSG